MPGATLSRLRVIIGADTSDLRGKLTGVARELDKIGSRLRSAGKTMTLGLTLTAVSLGGLAVRAAGQLDSLERGLVAVTGSIEETHREMARLKEVAKLPGLGFSEAIQGSINLQAAGFSATLAERALKAFGNALATVGRGKDDLFGVITALQQIEAKGKVSAEEINQLQERLPGIRKAMIAAFGTADTEILQEMKLSSEDFVEAIIREFEKLPPVTGGVQNKFENLGDSLAMAANTIAKQLLPAVLPLVDGLSNVLSRIEQLDPVTVRWGIALAAVAAASGPLLTLVGTITQLTVAIRALAPALGALKIAGLASGVGILVAGLGLVGAWFIKHKLDALAAAGAVETFDQKLTKLTRSEAIAEFRDVQRRIEGLKEMPATQFAVGEINKLGAQRRQLLDLLAELRPTSGGPKGPPTVPKTAEQIAAEIAKALDAALDRVRVRLGTAIDQLGTRLAGVGFEESRHELGPAGLLGLPNGPVAIAPKEATPVTFGMRVHAAGGLLRQGDLSGAGKALTGSDLAGKALGGLAGGAMKLLSVFNPLTLIGEMLKGAFQAIAPAIDALQVPVQMVATAFGTALAPILKALFPVFKAVTIAATYVGQVFFVVAGGIGKAIGSLIHALGVVIDKIPFLGDFGLKKLGDSIKATGQGFLDGAAALGDARDEIKGLNWDDLQKSTDAVNRSLQNVPQGFKVSLARFRATMTEASNPAASSATRSVASTAAAGDRPGSVTVGDINIYDANDPQETYTAFRRQLIAKTRSVGGDSYRFALALPA